MIARVWHGYTTPGNADAYRELLTTKILPRIEAEHGCGVHLYVRDVAQAGEVEFVTTCFFKSVEQIKQFAGDDYEACVVPAEARALLKRFDERSQHYELVRDSYSERGQQT